MIFFLILNSTYSLLFTLSELYFRVYLHSSGSREEPMNEGQGCSVCFLGVRLGSQHRKPAALKSRKEELLQLWGDSWCRTHTAKGVRKEERNTVTGCTGRQEIIPMITAKDSSRMDGWTERAAWAMKAGANMKIAKKTVCVFVLLTISKAARTAGESNWAAKSNSRQQSWWRRV